MSRLDGSVTRTSVERYHSAMARLSPADRELLVQRLELERSYEEIARHCGLGSADKARVAVQKAIRRLACGIVDNDALLPFTERRLRLPRVLKVLLRWPWRDPDPD